ncbi:hypothetical protein [Heyndrickxia sporothermodurans]|nr:hypothetical protein [Heyndrickxia sporothermodurans]MED3656356.1 hypothetical protein [Heyndrickxia sporothermodurans]
MKEKNIIIHYSQTHIKKIQFKDGDEMDWDWCPLCNGVNDDRLLCPACDGRMLDQGRIYDYYDDYSPYMDIDLIKLADGVPNSSKRNECVHLFKCSNCGVDLPKKITY